MQSREVRERYLRIINDFVTSKKVYQVLNSDNGDSGSAKARINLALSSRGLGGKIVALQVNDSVHLINRNLARHSHHRGD
jgi:hypothetical protein